MEIKKEDLKKVIEFIEENLRASDFAGIEFIDAKDYLGRISRNQNHVIFGRRGAGKSCLISSLDKLDSKVLVKINVEDFKNISYPNIILHVLKTTFEQIYEMLNSKTGISIKRYKVKKTLRKEIENFSKLIYEPDNIDENIKNLTKEDSLNEGSIKRGFFSFRAKKNKGRELEVSKSITKSKLDYLLLDLPKYKNIFKNVSISFNDTAIFLVFDDFYFLQKKRSTKLFRLFSSLVKRHSTLFKGCYN